MSKVVFISGVSSGFGYAISELLTSRGYKVYGTIRRETKIPDKVIPVHMELTQPETIKDAVKKVITREGRIDILINNAGMHSGGPIEEIEENVYRKHIETNLFGWLKVLQETLPHMRQAGGGLIINISSIGGLTGLPFQGIYSSTKFAIEGISQALRAEVKAFNIKVVVINPGDFRTNNTESRVISLKENSAYAAQFKKSMAVIEKDEYGGMDPKRLARKVLGIIEKKRPLHRYVVASWLQRLACIVKRLIPERYFSRIIADHYRIK